MSKKSFLIYTDLLSSLDELNDEQVGKVFRAIRAYHMSHSEGEGRDWKAEFDGLMNDFVTRIVFAPFRASFERDAEKYRSIVERNRKNGKNGSSKKETTQETQEAIVGSATTQESQVNPVGSMETQESQVNPVGSMETQESQVNPVGSTETQKNPKNPKNPNRTDNDNDNDNDNDKYKEKLSNESTKKDGDVSSPTPAPERPPTPYENFMSWMKDNAPEVYRNFGHKMTQTEYDRIRGIIDKTALVDYVLAMENRKDLVKKYSSLYLTLRNWIRRDEKKS